uniref:Uncharacterized protein n=1 Tax=Anopheles farauti TaxID=69004 RepID=A0A182QTW5_9DIPT
MEHAHQLVKVTNFILYLMLLLPLQTTSTSSATDGSTLNLANTNTITAGGGPAGALGKSSTDFSGPIGAASIASSGRDRSHLKAFGQSFIEMIGRGALGSSSCVETTPPIVEQHQFR